MSLSLIGRSISQSATLKLNETAAVLKAKGEPVIHLGGGEPKTKPPVEALVAAAGLLNTGELRYTPTDGIPALKHAIIRYTEQYYGRVVAPENIIASNGAKQSVMVCLQAILNPKEEVIFPVPYWVSYPEMVKLCGGIPVAVKSEDGSLHPRIEDIERNVTAYTKAVIINSPNNPSGVLYSPEFIYAIVEMCERRGLYLIMDDIYHRLVFDGKIPPNPYTFAKDLSDNSKLVIINGVSKTYAMTGFRIGWTIASKKLVEVMTNIQSHQTSGPAAVNQYAAVAALSGVQTSVESLRLKLENNRNILMARLDGFDGVRATKPDGTFYCFVDFRHYDKDSTRLAQYLLDKVRVVTVPGVEFGLEGHLRISTAGTVKDIISGFERIQWALDPDAPNEIYIGDRKLTRDWTMAMADTSSI